MSKAQKVLRIITVCVLVIGFVSCKSKKYGETGKQLPFQRPLLPPLLPPVPPIKQIEFLTKKQLSFIRHHQNLQQTEKATYNPYSCLPKYICIVDDEAGNKRTTIVSGLHPALQNENKNENAINSARIDVPQLSIHNHPDPEGLYRDRIVDDGFLKEQEVGEKLALEKSLIRSHPKLKVQKQTPTKGSVEESTENNSDESNEDKNDEESSEDEEEGMDSHDPKSRRRQPLNSMEGPGSQEDSFEEPNAVEDNLRGHFATVPWDDSSNPFKNNNKSIVSQLKSIFLPNPKDEDTPTTTERGILKRMLYRGKRDAKSNNPFMTNLGPEIKSSDQCRILYNGCDLNYGEIMQIAGDGQVLIEGDDDNSTPPKKSKPNKKYSPPEDDEADQVTKDAPIKHKRPLKLQPGFNKIKYPKRPQYIHPNSPYSNHIKQRPKPYRPANDEGDGLSIPSLPILPMKFHFGKPVYGPPLQPRPYESGEDNQYPPSRPPPPPQPTITTTVPPPIFVKNPVYKKVNRTITKTEIIKVNSTHAFEIVKPTSKPYRPVKAPLHDKNGRPVSFASVFTEIAGSSGGIHDFFDKVANAVGGPPSTKRVQKHLKAEPSSLIQIKRRGKINSEEGSEEEEEEEDDDKQQDEEGSEEEEEVADDVHKLVADDVHKPLANKGKKYTIKKKVPKNKDKKKVAKPEDEEDDDDDEEVNDDVNEEVSNEEEANDDENNEEVNDDENNEKEEEVNDDENNDKEEGVNDDVSVEVDLPDSLPDHIKQGIIDDIINPGKRQKEAEAAKKGQGDEGEDSDEEGAGQMQDSPPGQGQDSQGFGTGQGPSEQGQGPPGYYRQSPNGPPPPRRGLFSSFG